MLKREGMSQSTGPSNNEVAVFYGQLSELVSANYLGYHANKNQLTNEGTSNGY